MNPTSVEEIANAVLYEGYLLYPYRASAVKNQKRFNFGVVMPRDYAQNAGSAERAEMTTDCLLLASDRSSLEIKARFLHLRRREVRVFDPPVPELTEAALARSSFVAELQHEGRTYRSCDEAVDREVTIITLVGEATGKPQRVRFSFGDPLLAEPIEDTEGKTIGAIVRTQERIQGCVEVSCQDCQIPVDERSGQLWRVTVEVSNESETPEREGDREEALFRSMLSLHAILRSTGGEFISLLDPPAPFAKAAALCRNNGWWPVLAGEPDRRDTVLSSPIILYDYPEIAAESVGELFDGTEIDEILTLRIMTLTDAEKEEMRQGDERARRILERTENMDPEELMRLHGVLRRPGDLEDELP